MGSWKRSGKQNVWVPIGADLESVELRSLNQKEGRKITIVLQLIPPNVAFEGFEDAALSKEERNMLRG